jgi:polygalacturonase
MRRRDFLAAGLGCAAVSRLAAGAAAPDPVAEILRRIRPPAFPDRTFDVLRFGAKGDGATDCRAAFARAIEECGRSGGGTVLIPSGTFLTNGPIHLTSNVNLHVAEGAKVLFGVNPEDYLPAVLTRWEGVRCYNYSPLIYCYRQKNVAITGRGVLDGQTRLFWSKWKQKQTPDQEALRAMGARREPIERRVFGHDHYLRPACSSPMIAPTSW